MMKIRFLALLLISYCALGAQISTDSLMAYYPFDSNVLDAGPNNFHGISYGTTYGEDEKGNPNSALFFDGIDDFVDLSAFATLFRENLGEMTILFKIKFEKEEDNQEIICFGNHGDNLQTNAFEIEYENNRFQIETEIGNMGANYEYEVDQTEQLFTQDWHQIMVTVEGDNLTYCRNGEIIYRGRYVPTESSSNSLFLGCFAGNTPNACCYFGGFIDDLQFYNRIIEKEELIVNASEPSWSNNINYYPNPTSNKVSFELNNFHKSISILLTDLQGKTILTREIKEIERFDLTMPHQAGLYLLQLVSENKVATFKIIKTATLP